jgi:large repetitive protein
VTAVPDATHATVHVTVSPTAPTGNHAVRMLTNLGGGGQEIAVYTVGSGNGTPGYFVVNAGPASITSATPTSPASVHQNDNGDIIAIVGSATHFTAATPTINFTCVGAPVAFQVIDDTHINATINVSTFATVGACGVTVTTGGEVATGSNLFNVLAGVPTITSVSANSAHQNDTLSININGLYTHFTSGGLTVFAGNPNITVNGSPTVNSDTSITVNITVSPTATVGATNVQVHDTTDGNVTGVNAFTVSAGTPQITSISIPNGPQGLTQAEHIVGLFTHWTASSVISVSGTGVTVGNPPTSPDNLNLFVSFSVAVGAPAGARTVTVTTGAEVVSLPGAFTVLPGSPSLQSLSPNIGVPNSVVNVTFVGVFTNWVNGNTTASFGPWISVNGAGNGNPGHITVNDATHATASLTIDPGANLGPYNVVINTPSAAESFTANSAFTIQSTPSTPVVTFLSPTMGLSGTVNASNVPINTSITVTFNEPMLQSSITSANAFITDGSVTGCWATSGLPATVTPDVSGRFVTITPTGLLPVGHTFYLQLNSYSVPGGTPTIVDASGTQNLGHYCQQFTTGFAQDASGPTFVTANFPAGSTGLPTNARVILGFDKPINANTISAGLSIVQDPATTVPGNWSYSTDFTQAIFTPASNFAPATAYTVTMTAALTDSVGHALTNPNALHFTTGAGTDNSGLTVTSITPVYNSTVSTNPLLRFVMNKPINPLTVNNVYVWNNTAGGSNPGSSLITGPVTHSADFKTWTMTLPAPLSPGTQYYLHTDSMYDWAGNCCSSFNQYFYTGTTADVTGPTVVSVSPAAAATGIAVNSPVWVRFSEPLDPTTGISTAITLNGGAVAGSVAFAPGPDYTTLVFTPSPNLSPSITYNVAVAGVEDASGNPLQPFAGSTFTTAASATPDTTQGTVTITPTGSNVPVNSNVVFQLNKAVNPLTVNSLSMRVYDNTAGKDYPGAIVVSANLKTLTYTPTVSFPANHQICTWDYNGAYLYDLAGNAFQAVGICFTTSNTPSLTPPHVLSVSPPDTSTGIGPNNPVAVTFNEPVNPGSLTNNVAVYIGSSLYTANYSLSGDSTTIYFSTGAMPYGTTFTVVVSPNVVDMEGHPLGTEFRSSFTTAPQPVTTRPQVNSIRPGTGASGVPTTATVTFFTSAPLNPATVNANTVHVSQNGALLTGALTFAANNQAITFTPAANFAPGALIEIWFTSGARDASNNPLFDYYSHFTTAPDLSATPLTISSRTCNFCDGSSPTNKVIEVLFNKPVIPATVTNASFFLKDTNNTNPVNGVISFFDGNRGIRITPNSPIPVGTYVYVYLTSAIQDTNNLSFAGSNSSYNFYVYTYNPVDNAAPFVTGIAPTNGAGNIGSNAVISVTFNENPDPLTLDPANVTLTGVGGNIPVSLSYNSNNLTLTITPQAPMPAGAVTLQMNGVIDAAGNALNPTPYNSTFTVVNAPDYNPPAVVLTSWQPNQSNVPVTSSFSITFDKPIDVRSVVLTNNVLLRDATLGYPNVAATLSWSSGNTVLLITPAAALNVGHLYNVYIYSLADLNGNVSGGILNQNFNTVLVAPSGGPAITQFVPPNGITNVPENFKPQIQFDRPIQATALGGVTMVKTVGSVPVAISVQLSAGGTLMTLVPNALLQPTTQYTVTVAGVVDAAGNPIAGSAARTFTTGPSIDLTAPQVISMTPIYNSTVGTNPLVKVVFNKPINPISATNFAMYQYSINRYVNALSLVWSADLKSVTFNYPGPLNGNDHYYFYLQSYGDLAGNTNNTPTQHFYTSSGVDNTPLTVTSVNPPSGAAGVPVNPTISIRLSKPAAPTSVSNSSVTVSGVAGSTVSLSADGLSLSVGLPGLLSANTSYTIQVLGGAFTDNNGNAVTAFSSSFTTSASGLSDTSHGGVSLTDPSPGSTGVALNKVITVTFSKPFNPNSMLQDSFEVCFTNDCNHRIAGTVAIVDANHLSFTPAVALPPGQTLGVFVYPFTAYMTDLAGNPFDSPYLYNATFSTASTADTTPPAVISNGMTPAPGTTGVGPLATVSLTFNKSLDINTVNTSNFALFQGATNLGANVSISADRRTVYLSITLPFSATVTATVNTNVKDYAGNNMASPFSGSFTTEAQPLNFNPSVIQVRPGNGAPVNSKITIFTNSRINQTSAQNGLQVAQNGSLIPGTVTLTADQQGIVWTPTSPFLAGAYIEVFVTTTVTDQNLNPINAYTFAFTTQTACTVPAATGYAPSRFSFGNYLTNQPIEIQFCEAINPATVTTTTMHVTSSSTPGSGTLIPGTFTFLANNTVVRFTPTSDWPTANYVAVQLTSGIMDAGAHPFAGDGYYFYVQGSATHDNTPPAVSSITPVNNATGIGDNAPVRIVFNKAIDTLTANPFTITLNGGAIPYTYTFNNTQTVMNITPLAALPDSSTITVDVSTGVADQTGAAVADFPISFQTAAGADFTAPRVIQLSVDNGNDTNVPVNTTFKLVFDKPLDPSTVVGNPAGDNTCCFFYYDSSVPGGHNYPPSTVNISPDLKTVTIVPSAPMTASIGNMRYYANSATDLNGNAMINMSQFFATAAGSDATPPTVVQTNPINGGTVAPTNSVIELIFSEAVRGTSLGSITLDGSPVTAILNNGVYGNDRVVRLVLSSLLTPGLHSVVATGVQDVAGNTMAGSYNFSFTAGANFNVAAPNFVSATVTTTGGTVPLPQNTNVNDVLDSNATFTFTWDAGIDPAAMLENGAIFLTDTSNNHINVPLTFTFPGTDQKTVQVQINGSLTSGTQYRIWTYYNSPPVGISGVYDYNQRMFPFTAH